MSAVTLTIRSDGKKIPDSVAVIGVDVVYEVNRIPYAQIRLHDGSAAEREFPVSDSADFEPGKTVEIAARHDDKKNFTLFKGVVVGHSIEVSPYSSQLVVDLKSSAVAMTIGRNSAVYAKQKDSQIIGKLIEQHGLKKGSVSSTETEHLALVQYNCTDWDFMLARAEANGLVVTITNETIAAAPIKLDGTASYTFAFGIDTIYDMEITVDAENQIGQLASIGWDVSNQKPTQNAKGKETKIPQGNLDASQIANKIGAKSTTQNNGVTPAKGELQAWSDAALARRRLSFIRGRIGVCGIGDIELLKLVEIKDSGKRFSGKNFVSGIRHRIDSAGWRTDIQIGLSPQPFARQPDILDVPAAGLLPAVHGLQIGVVDQFEEDPDKNLRVKVRLPAIDAEKGIVWARIGTPYAGKERGYFFWPEVGDEVIVGFFNDDPRQAVILGSLYNAKNVVPKPISAPKKDNDLKAIVTRSGVTILVDDKKKSIKIETPGKNSFTLDDDGKKIELKDQHGNQVTLDDKGITLKSAKDFTVEASGKVKIKGTEVDVNA